MTTVALPSRAGRQPTAMSTAARLGGRMLALIAVSTILACTVNLFHPRALPWTENWSERVDATIRHAGFEAATVARASAIIEAGEHLVFDARPMGAYDVGHLPSALSLPVASIDEVLPQWQAALLPEQKVMVYCGGEACDESLKLAHILREMGVRQIAVFAGGYDAWKKAGLPIER